MFNRSPSWPWGGQDGQDVQSSKLAISKLYTREPFFMPYQRTKAKIEENYASAVLKDLMRIVWGEKLLNFHLP